MTTNERQSAHTAAFAAITLDKAGDAAGRERAMDDLWSVAGYYKVRTLEATKLRGEKRAPMMIRFPAGRSQPWHTHRVLAAQAWAAID